MVMDLYIHQYPIKLFFIDTDGNIFYRNQVDYNETQVWPQALKINTDFFNPDKEEEVLPQYASFPAAPDKILGHSKRYQNEVDPYFVRTILESVLQEAAKYGPNPDTWRMVPYPSKLEEQATTPVHGTSVPANKT